MGTLLYMNAQCQGKTCSEEQLTRDGEGGTAFMEKATVPRTLPGVCTDLCCVHVAGLFKEESFTCDLEVMSRNM